MKYGFALDTTVTENETSASIGPGTALSPLQRPEFRYMAVVN